MNDVSRAERDQADWPMVWGVFAGLLILFFGLVWLMLTGDWTRVL